MAAPSQEHGPEPDSMQHLSSVYYVGALFGRFVIFNNNTIILHCICIRLAQSQTLLSPW